MDSIKDVFRCSVKVPEFDKHLKKAGGHIDRNVLEITIKMKTLVRELLMIRIKLHLRNLDNKHQKKAGGHIGRNFVEITIKMKIIVRQLLMTKNTTKQPSIESSGYRVALSKAALLPILWSHSDTSSCSSWWRTRSLKLPPPFGWWSVKRAECNLWIRTSDNSKELGPDNMLIESTFRSILCSHAHTSSYSSKRRTLSLKHSPPQGCWNFYW